MWELNIIEKLSDYINNIIVNKWFKILKQQYWIDYWKYPIEELLKMYNKHKKEIQKT